MPIFILIRPTVWPECTNVTDRTGQTDRQRTDSIGRTVLHTVAQKGGHFWHSVLARISSHTHISEGVHGCNFNCGRPIKAEGRLKVTGSPLHGKTGNISEMTQDIDVVTTGY